MPQIDYMESLTNAFIDQCDKSRLKKKSGLAELK